MNLFLIPILLGSWIMSWNPGFEDWISGTPDTLRYAQYAGYYYLYKHDSDLDGGSCLIQLASATAGPGNLYILIPVRTSTVGYDTVVFYLKIAPTNERNGVYLFVQDIDGQKYYNFTTNQWQTSASVVSFGGTTSWQRFTKQIKFTYPGIYRACIRRLDNPSSGVDTFFIDSFYVKRTHPMEITKRMDGFKGLGYNEYIGTWDDFNSYRRFMFEAGIKYIRMWVHYHSVLQSMDYANNSWTGDVTDLVNAINTYQGNGLIIDLGEKFPGDYQSLGMRMWDIGSGVMFPYKDDACFHMSHLLQELRDAGVTDIKNWGVFNEIGWQIDQPEEAESVRALYEALRDTINAYYPNSTVMIRGTFSTNDEATANSVGYSFLSLVDRGSYHIYGTALDFRNDDYRQHVLALVNKFLSFTWLNPDDWEDKFVDEYTTDFTPITEKESPKQWLALPGVFSYYAPTVLMFHCWFGEATSCPMITLDGNLHAGYYGFKFIAPYLNKKITAIRKDCDYFIVKIEPETYLIANPYDKDTIDVELPKSGFAKVRWLDPNTEFPILTTEHRSPIYQKYMALGNRLTIKRGFMYAIEYVR